MVSWSALFSGYARLGHGSEAREVYQDMEDKGIQPNVVFCDGYRRGQWGGMLFGISVDNSKDALQVQKKSDSVGIGSIGDHITEPEYCDLTLKWPRLSHMELGSNSGEFSVKSCYDKWEASFHSANFICPNSKLIWRNGILEGLVLYPVMVRNSMGLPLLSMI
ncbi:hypothetical protein RHMOL_Rhmol03G0056800 [Rhododendron molle]|uniref:Uncharacterized protein n=1 Tax=Rhododendron molle TaxID=49168 RepID=A0ACC0PCH5_RHOML|nr:hypothetical protein RHMOL_Rhmol03G0056800 [Rhododendron molle]